ncbi:ZIP family metal transporter [Mannheimia indoligenes]|uniref:ZIP family metal transporter n=1 Tax=Mannheimia indoligenes TaxID=3103145 RepID=UPI002FE64442
MFEYFLSLSPIWQAFLAGLFTWGCTILGSSFVYFFRSVNRKLLDSMMGFAAGVMIAASFWSLLSPSLDYAEADYGELAWLPAAIGFLAGGAFIRLIDYIVPHLHLSKPIEQAEGNKQLTKGLSKTTLLFLAITIHNIPEGLAIGVTFGALASQIASVDASIMGAIGLAIGIGLQNIPEGSSLALPIRAEGHSRKKAFWYGAMSAAVEPIAAVIGAIFVLSMTAILPYALAFAAGAMIFVVVEELIPESQSNGHTDIATLSLMLGFVVMMILDVALG